MSGFSLTARDVATAYSVHELTGRGTREGEQSVGETKPSPSENPFGRLTRLVASNDRHLAALAALDVRLSAAEESLASGASHGILGRAYRDMLKRRRSEVMAILRANRIKAREFLSR